MKLTKKIIIDAGHGGEDFGATYKHRNEKDLSLLISLEMSALFSKLGYNVELTRTADYDLSPNKRTGLIKRFGADYCISNHINAGGGAGAEVIYSIHQDGSLAELILSQLKKAGLKTRRAFNRANDNGKDLFFMHRDSGSTRTLIVEYAFIDNLKDMDNFIKNYQSAILNVVSGLDLFIKRSV